MSQKEELLLKTPDVQVRVMHLDPGEAVAWHSHTAVDDIAVCLSGRIQVRLRDPNNVHTLEPGQRARVPAGTVHQVANLEASDSDYLLIQGVGTYDFLPAGSA
jgi:quercetin dioxygenase-like cupin family protein